MNNMNELMKMKERKKQERKNGIEWKETEKWKKKERKIENCSTCASGPNEQTDEWMKYYSSKWDRMKEIK
jgi:hypothetical protein